MVHDCLQGQQGEQLAQLSVSHEKASMLFKSNSSVRLRTQRLENLFTEATFMTVLPPEAAASRTGQAPPPPPVGHHSSALETWRRNSGKAFSPRAEYSSKYMQGDIALQGPRSSKSETALAALRAAKGAL